MAAKQAVRTAFRPSASTFTVAVLEADTHSQLLVQWKTFIQEKIKILKAMWTPNGYLWPAQSQTHTRMQLLSGPHFSLLCHSPSPQKIKISQGTNVTCCVRKPPFYRLNIPKILKHFIQHSPAVLKPEAMAFVYSESR